MAIVVDIGTSYTRINKDGHFTAEISSQLYTSVSVIQLTLPILFMIFKVKHALFISNYQTMAQQSECKSLLHQNNFLSIYKHP